MSDGWILSQGQTTLLLRHELGMAGGWIPLKDHIGSQAETLCSGGWIPSSGTTLWFFCMSPALTPVIGPGLLSPF